MLALSSLSLLLSTKAYIFDKENKKNKWTEAIKPEVNQMGEHRVFKKLPMGNVPDDECQQIPYHFVFDVRFEIRPLS